MVRPAFCRRRKDGKAMNSDDKAFFQELLEDGNYLGAAQFLREQDMNASRRGAYMGQVVQQVINDLGRARSKNDRERVVFLRSALAWMLKDFPGLASVYREQLRLANGGNDLFPDFARGVRNMGDVISGRKTVQEGVEDAQEPLESLADKASDFFRDGLNQVGDFFAGLNRAPFGSNPESSETSDATSEDAKHGEAEPTTGDESQAPHQNSRPVDISVDEIEITTETIEEADAPLPHNIHRAGDDGENQRL